MKKLFPSLFALAAILIPNALQAAPGDLYEADAGSGKIFKFTPNGNKTAFASSLGGPGLGPDGVALDSQGNLFVSSGTNVFKFTPDGAKTTFASGFGSARGLAVDSSDNLFAVDYNNGLIAKITPSMTKTNFATGLTEPVALAFDNAGDLYVIDSGTSTGASSILKFTPNGKTSFALGLSQPAGLAFDNSGNLYVAIQGTREIFKFTPSGFKTTFASGIVLPVGVAVDASNNVFVTVSNGTILKITPNGTKSPFAGNLSAPQQLVFERATGQSLNISTRLKVQTGDNVLIAGFIITGTQTKNVLLRGIGPSLANFGVPGALQDPTLELYAGATKLGTNDNWKIYEATGASQQAAIQSTGIPPSDDRESAIDINLPPGAYTAILRGKNNTTGVGSVELYDLSQTSTLSNVANISTRGFVDAGDNVMIGGFIIGGGDGYGKVIVRAIGPSLAAAGVSNSLADPTLELHNATGTLIDQNDDWKIGNQAAIQATTIPPTNDKESAIVTTLPAGSYTVIVKGYNGGTGVGLVEVYNLK